MGIYGEVDFDTKDGTWLHIPNFPLPKGWNWNVVSILIDIPDGIPGYPSRAPEWFWTNKSLRTGDGQPIGHFFTNNANDAKYAADGWGHFCVHLNEWSPRSGANWTSGHSLVTYLNLIRMIFRDQQSLRSR
jgi:hypothetical protein